MLHLFLATGFEETEAILTVDILRRCGLSVQTVSVTGDRLVTGSHQIIVKADALLSETDIQNSEALILPGGMPGAINLQQSKQLSDALSKQCDQGRIVAAICAAPLVLGELGLLIGKRATCYPGFENHLKGACLCNEPVVQDGTTICGRGPATIPEFAFLIASNFVSLEVVQNVRKGMLFDA